MSAPRSTRPLARSLAAIGAAALVALLALLGGAPAGAHGGDGDIEVTSATREGDQVDVTVRVFYVGDGHGVPDATVTLVVDDGTPVPMAAGDEEGIYTGTVTAAPGATIRVTSAEPSVSVEATAPDETPTSTESPEATDASSTELEAPDTSAPDTTAATGDAESTDGPDDAAAPVPTSSTGDDDDSSNTGLILGLVALVVVVGGVAAFVVLRKPTPDADA